MTPSHQVGFLLRNLASVKQASSWGSRMLRIRQGMATRSICLPAWRLHKGTCGCGVFVQVYTAQLSVLPVRAWLKPSLHVEQPCKMQRLLCSGPCSAAQAHGCTFGESGVVRPAVTQAIAAPCRAHQLSGMTDASQGTWHL